MNLSFFSYKLNLRVFFLLAVFVPHMILYAYLKDPGKSTCKRKVWKNQYNMFGNLGVFSV